MKRLIFLLGVVFLLVLASAANANLMAVWDFGPSSDYYTLVPQYEYVSGVPTLDAGNADYDDNGGNGVEFTDAAGNYHIAGQALHWGDVSKSGDNDAYIIITINTTGWQDMSIRWDYMSDNSGDKTGPVSFDLDYQVDDGEWTNIVDNYAITRDDAWHQFSYDLSSLTAINNQPSVQFRINDFDENDLSGDYWQDNIQFTGVPEPMSIAFLALGGIALLRKRTK
ncbi:MAG: hypothetical protein PHQ35_00675 [Phycisphaerae bacterium]|nr:hypothetical protein [Phycisphaerae bacterium]MDD5381421.1 hypothetical protein [Phycisphaerae bacterium]